MSYNLNYTIQVAGAHTYSKCVGEVVVLLIELKVRKDTLVMSESLIMSLQLKTLIVQVFKTITEVLGEGGSQWTGGEVCHGNSTNLLAKYQISDGVGSNFASGSLLENIRDLLCQVELGKSVSEWVGVASLPKTERRGKGDVGEQPAILNGVLDLQAVGYHEGHILPSGSLREPQKLLHGGPQEPDTGC